MRWKSLCAAVAASFALLADKAMSEQGEQEPDDSDRQAYAAHRTRLAAAKNNYDTAPRNADPQILGRTIKSATVRDSECVDLSALGYKRLGSLFKKGLSYDTADCSMPAVGSSKFAVYGDPHDIFVYTSGEYNGRSLKGNRLREVDGQWVVFDGERPVMEDGVPLTYTKGSPYDDDRLRLDGVEGVGEGFGSMIMYRNRFGDHIFFMMVEGRTTQFSIWPIDDWPHSTVYQRQCDGRFTEVEQPLPLDCGDE